MMRTGKTLALALSVLTFTNGAWALTSDSSGNPYHGIVERNIFDIHAALPPPPPDPNIGRPPPPTIKLQGITDILGRKQVLFKVQLPPKGGAPAKEESFILTVGERQGEIEVLEINPKAGTVKMNNYGVVTNLSLELNSDKLVNVAPVAAPAAAPNPAQMTAPGAIAPPPTLPTLPPGRFPRTLRLPGSSGNQTTLGNPGNSDSSINSGGTANQQPIASETRYSFKNAEDQEVMIEALRLKYQREGNSMADMLPPTKINPTANTVLKPTPNQAPPNQVPQ